MREFTEKQKEKIRKELSLDNINSKYNKFMCKLQDKFDPLHVGKHILPANVIYLEELFKDIKSLKPIGHGFLIILPDAKEDVSFYYDILDYAIDELILEHTKIQTYKIGPPNLIVTFNAIFKDIDKQVKAFLKSLDKKKKDEKI